MQSLRVVDVLANDGRGLNLTDEVRQGIVRHSKGQGVILPADAPVDHGSVEAEVVRLCDIVAYVNHDLDDATRAGLLAAAGPPPAVQRHLERSYSGRIGWAVRETLAATDLDREPHLRISAALEEQLVETRDFLYATAYRHPQVAAELEKARRVLVMLWEHVETHPDPYLGGPGSPLERGVPLRTAVADFIAGMTDDYALALFDRVLVPRRWPA